MSPFGSWTRPCIPTVFQIFKFSGIPCNPERCLSIIQYFHVDLRHASHCASTHTPNRYTFRPETQIHPDYSAENTCCQFKRTTAIYTHSFFRHQYRQTKSLVIFFRIRPLHRPPNILPTARSSHKPPISPSRLSIEIGIRPDTGHHAVPGTDG